MNTLLVLACLGACLLIAINQLRLSHRIEDDLVPAINQCDKDIESVEKLLAPDEDVKFVALPRTKAAR